MGGSATQHVGFTKHRCVMGAGGSLQNSRQSLKGEVSRILNLQPTPTVGLKWVAWKASPLPRPIFLGLPTTFPPFARSTCLLAGAFQVERVGMPLTGLVGKGGRAIGRPDHDHAEMQ